MVTILHSALGSFQNELPDIQPNKHGFYEIGDIVLDEEQFNETFYPSDEMLRGTVDEKRWPNGVIPYTFVDAATNEQKQMVADAVSYFNSQMEGCLKIR